MDGWIQWIDGWMDRLTDGNTERKTNTKSVQDVHVTLPKTTRA